METEIRFFALKQACCSTVSPPSIQKFGYRRSYQAEAPTHHTKRPSHKEYVVLVRQVLVSYYLLSNKFPSINFHFPSAKSSPVQSAILVLCKDTQRLFTASHILFTWWYFPSISVRIKEKPSILTAFAGKVISHGSISTPSSSLTRSSSEISFSHITLYSFSFLDFREIIRWLRLPSLVAKTNHVVSWSSLPATFNIGA